MPTPLAVLYIFGGVVWLLMGGDILIRGAVALSRKAGVSPLVVGLTVVAFGTSAPELVVSLNAALSDANDISIGNVVGSSLGTVTAGSGENDYTDKSGGHGGEAPREIGTHRSSF